MKQGKPDLFWFFLNLFMETLFNLFLILHIAGGSIGLLSGSLNLIQTKGNKKHRIVGKAFVYSMLTTGISALILSAIHPNNFLFIVGVFTIYLVATGNRFIYLKMLGKSQRPTIVDRGITLGMLITALVFIVLGIKNLLASNNFGVVFIVFGALGLRFIKTDFDNYKGNFKSKNYWLLVHLQRMTGAYIAAVTAFLVVNAKHSPINLPPAVFWLLPTFILTPLIISWSRKYKIKPVSAVHPSPNEKQPVS